MWSSLLMTVAIVAGRAEIAAARGSGAPMGACVTLQPAVRTGAHPAKQTTTSPYTVSVTAAQYTPGTPVIVTVAPVTVTDGYQGILLQARKADNSSTDPVGTFSTIPANTKLLMCTAADDSVTHANTNVKTGSTEFTWNPPAWDAGNVYFVMTVARNQQTYWVMVKSSEVLQYKAKAPTMTPEGVTVVVPELTTSSSSYLHASAAVAGVTFIMNMFVGLLLNA